MDRFKGTPEGKIVKCNQCDEDMEFLTDGENIDGKNFCWDCWDEDYPDPLDEAEMREYLEDEQYTKWKERDD